MAERKRDTKPVRQVSPGVKRPEPLLDLPQPKAPEDAPASPEGDVWKDSSLSEEADPGAYHEGLAASAETENQNLWGARGNVARPEDVEALRERYPNAIGPQFTEATTPVPGVDVGLPPGTVRRRDPAVVAATHSFRVPLSRDVLSVKTGTPLKPTPAGYVPTLEDDAMAVAAVFGEGGTMVNVYKIVTLETYARQFVGGRRYRVDKLDDYGTVYFKEDAAGPYEALTDTQIMMDVTARRG